MQGQSEVQLMLVRDANIVVDFGVLQSKLNGPVEVHQRI